MLFWKAQNVYVLPTFDWKRFRNLGSLYDKLPKDEQENAVECFSILRMQPITSSELEEKTIVIDGLTDYIIVDKTMFY